MLRKTSSHYFGNGDSPLREYEILLQVRFLQKCLAALEIRHYCGYTRLFFQVIRLLWKYSIALKKRYCCPYSKPCLESQDGIFKKNRKKKPCCDLNPQPRAVRAALPTQCSERLTATPHTHLHKLAQTRTLCFSRLTQTHTHAPTARSKY